MSEPRTGLQRRIRWMAILLALVALGFYVAFFFSVSHRGH